MRNLKQAILRNTINAPGFRTKRKLILIESDDWGSIRMPSKNTYDHLLNAGTVLPNDPFAKYDSLASEKDLSELFELLSTFTDYKGTHPIITANCVVANPDFERIRVSNFREYYYELFTETLQRYPKHHNSFNLWKQGINNKIFFPQYHGREHVNVNLWLEKLINGSDQYINAFNHETFAVDASVAAAFSFRSESERVALKSIIIEGNQLFAKLFDYNSETFIAPNYTWDEKVEEVLASIGIKFIQGSKRQNIPILNSSKLGRKYHFTGQKNKYNQYYLVRNCLFEPSISPSIDYVSACLKHISNAFFWNKPAVISSHRLNYIGFLDEKNRSNNLAKLKNLLRQILKYWSRAEFITSAELGNIINNSHKSASRN